MPKKSKTIRVRRKYIFTLRNINTEQIDQKYGITLMSNITEEEPDPTTTTRLDDLLENKRTPEVISFLDESKHLRKCAVSMIDHVTQKPLKGSYSCFWCRNPIPDGVTPVGCPIRYVSDQAVKSYYSEISRDRYTIKENITTKRSRQLAKKKDKRMSLLKRNYYLTDGAFCSFNCVVAFIEDPANKIDPMYRDSGTLVLKVYNSMHKDKVNVIEGAHHWRKLISYGGDLTIDQFRENFNKIEYVNHGLLVDYPRFHSLGVLFEEKLKF